MALMLFYQASGIQIKVLTDRKNKDMANLMRFLFSLLFAGEKRLTL